jgi:hypothetical protein
MPAPPHPPAWDFALQPQPQGIAQGVAARPRIDARHGPWGTRQVKFESSEDFYGRLMDERLQRNLTIQQLAIRSLERYFALPESVHRMIEERAKIDTSAWYGHLSALLGVAAQDNVTLSQPHDPGTPLSVEESRKAQEMTEAPVAIQHYLEQLPIEKVQTVRASLALDLKHYRQSRFKPPEPVRGRRTGPFGRYHPEDGRRSGPGHPKAVGARFRANDARDIQPI